MRFYLGIPRVLFNNSVDLIEDPGTEKHSSPRNICICVVKFKPAKWFLYFWFDMLILPKTCKTLFKHFITVWFSKGTG